MGWAAHGLSLWPGRGMAGFGHGLSFVRAGLRMGFSMGWAVVLLSMGWTVHVLS